MEVLNISAAQGDPSTFWQGASGRYYRTKADAETDDMSKAVDPANYYYSKSFWAKNKKTIIWSIVAIIIIGGMIWLYKTGRINIIRHK